MALNIFFSSAKLFFSKWEPALHLMWVFIFVYLIGVLLFALLHDLLGGSSISLIALFSLVCVVFIPLVALSASVGWMRHLLLGEPVPPFHIVNFNWPWLPFFWAGTRLTLALVALVLVWMAITAVSGFVVNFAGTFAMIIPIIIALGGMFLINVTLFRLSLILPVAALGNKMTLMEAFNSTAGYGWVIFRLILVLFLAQIILGLPLTILQFSTMDPVNLVPGANMPINIAVFGLNMFLSLVFSLSFVLIHMAAIVIIYAQIHENRSLLPEPAAG